MNILLYCKLLPLNTLYKYVLKLYNLKNVRVSS